MIQNKTWRIRRDRSNEPEGACFNGIVVWDGRNDSIIRPGDGVVSVLGARMIFCHHSANFLCVKHDDVSNYGRIYAHIDEFRDLSFVAYGLFEKRK